jgi:hypothetical protein
MVIKDKWKVFAFRQSVSSWDEDKYTAIEAYKKLEDADYETLEAEYKECDICPWQPFEDWSISDQVNHMADLAWTAQATENDVELNHADGD